MSKNTPRVAVIGIDGAHFELIEPWLKQKNLPNLRKVLNKGISGELESVLPPVTSPNWKAYATGKNPGKFGIFWWENVDTNNQRIYYPNHRKHSQPEFWDILANDRRVGVIGVPTTHPAREVGEFMISGAPDGEESGFAYPSNLESDLKQKYKYRVTAKNKFNNDIDKASQEVLELIDTRFKVAKELCEQYEPEFLQVTTFYINALHHFLWNHEYTRQGWECIDDHLAYFLEEFDDIILMSDHGSTEISYRFNINAWLEKEEYLVSRNTNIGHLASLGIHIERLSNIANTFGMKDHIKRYVPSNIIRRIPNRHGAVKKEGKSNVIDWDSSQALASGQGPVYLTETRDSERYNTIRRKIMKDIGDIRAPDGLPIANNVYRGEELYEMTYAPEVPDIVIEQRPGIHIAGDLGRSELFSKPKAEGWVGENKRQGLFAAYGKSFKTGNIDLSILDLAPTILHLYRQPIPTDMDGTVQREIFADKCDAANENIEYVDESSNEVSSSAERGEDIEERLEDLGYL